MLWGVKSSRPNSTQLVNPELFPSDPCLLAVSVDFFNDCHEDVCKRVISPVEVLSYMCARICVYVRPMEVDTLAEWVHGFSHVLCTSALFTL